MSASGVARTIGRVVGIFAVALTGYLLAAVVLGLLPVNRAFAPAADGIEVFLVTNGVHAGLAFPLNPMASAVKAELPPPPQPARPGDDYLVVGWGDSRVYPATGTLRDLTLRNAVTSLLGLNGAVMHVEYAPRPQPSDRFRATRVSPEAYARLLAHVARSFERDEAGRTIRWESAENPAATGFYRAKGRYQPFHTCNEWVRRGLASAGIRTARWSPFDIALFHQFPR